MSGRYELYSSDPETGATSLFALTDSAFSAEKWVRDGGTVIDTSITIDARKVPA